MRILPIIKSAPLVLKLVLLFVVLCWAATSTVQPANYTGEAGTMNTVDNLTVSAARGFSKAASASSAAGTSCLSPVTFGSGTVANIAISSGNIIFDIQVNTTASTPASTCFKVTFFLSTSIASQTQYGPVYLSTSSSVSANQAIDCKFDTGSTSLPASPFSYKVAVQ